MKTGQSITLGLGAALVLASLWRGQQFQDLWKIITNQDTSTQLVPILKNIGLDALFLIIVVWIAGFGDDAPKMTAALLVALWLLFLFHSGDQVGTASAGSKQSPSFVVGNPGTWLKV